MHSRLIDKMIHEKFTGKMIRFCLLILMPGIITFEAMSQNRPGYFGKKNLLSFEKNIGWYILADKNSKAVKQGFGPILKIERITGRNTTLGFSFAHNKFELNDPLHDFRDIYPITYNERLIITYYGHGTLKVRSNTYLFHIKQYFSERAMAPVGGYVVIDGGIVSSKMGFGDDFRVYDDMGVAYSPAEGTAFKFKQLVLGLNFGRTRPLFGSRWLWDLSWGIGVKIRTTHYSIDQNDEWVKKSSDYVLNHQLFRIKLGINYAF